MYQALYRKWRPRSFDDVISQPHITTALRNQIREEKTAHAYLFTGSRGTGKTTCARIFAKAINCTHRTASGNPCLACDICQDAERGALSDIIEIDAASNNSVDDIRDLREGTVYLPERCRYKVYIIDEIHMLSPSAWGALLKVMEEPPAHVKFILATTEIHKVPATIVSRCQRYTFHRIRTEDITQRLLEIAAQEQIDLEPAGAQLIAHLSDGGMRDALSLLDQCASLGGTITASSVTAAAGVAGRDSIFAILQAVQQQDGAKALAYTGQLYDQSKDMARLCDELLEQLRNLMLLRAGAGQPELLTCLPEEQAQLKALSKEISLEQVIWAIGRLQECHARMAHSLNKRVELEMTLLQLTTPMRTAGVSSAPASAPQVAAESEEQPAAVPPAVSTPAAIPSASAADAASARNFSESEEGTGASAPAALEPITNWADILEQYGTVNPAVRGSLAESQAFRSGNTVFILAANRFFLTLLKNRDNAISLEETIRQCLGLTGSINIRAKLAADTQPQPPKAQDLIQKAKGCHLDTAVETS